MINVNIYITIVNVLILIKKVIIGRKYMATKKEWTEYFELINDRQPNAEEVLAAVESGEISVHTNDTQTTSTAPKAELSEDANRVYTNAKQHAGNYWTWIKPIVAHPSEQVNVTSNIFLWLTFAIATITGAFSVSNVVRRGLNVAFQSYSSFSGSEAATVHQQLSSFNIQLFFYMVVGFAVMYLAAVPGLLLINRNVFNLKSILEKYLKWFAPLALVNIIGAILSFLVPIPSISISSLDDVSSIMQTIFSSFGIIAVIIIIGIAILTSGQQFMVAEAHQGKQKIDALWLVLGQWIITIIVIGIELKYIVGPLLETLSKSIGNV